MADQMKILREQIDRFVEDARRKRNDKDRQFLMENIGVEIGRNLMPLMKTLADNTRLNKEDFSDLVLYLKEELAKIQIPIPEIIMPDIPQPKVTVNMPPIKIPEIRMPDEMNIKGWVNLMGVDLNNPLPVQLRDAKGNPVSLFDNLTQIIGGGGGGMAKNITLGGITSSAFGNILNADGRLRVETNDSGGATTEVRQVSGAVDSVVVNDVLVTVGVNQVSGANWSVNVTNTVPVSSTDLDVRDLTDVSDSIRAYQLSGAIWSVSVAEQKAEDAAHVSGDTGFMALSVRNSTNTTFAADGDYQPIATDGIGRPITRPVQTRGLLQTAYASISTGTEATLLAGASGVYFDLIYLMGTNNSDAAVTVDLRSATGGGIVSAMRIPANGTAGVSLAVPLPQDAAADTWTIDMPDITGTTITVSALFSREV